MIYLIGPLEIWLSSEISNFPTPIKERWLDEQLKMPQDFTNEEH